MFKNATFKLTISYLCVVMVISIVFSAVVYRVGTDNLAFGLNRESRELSAAFPIFNGTQYAAPNTADLNSGKRHLFDQLILTNLIVLVGAGFISYMLARETLKPIQDAHEQQKRFTADVSHELRTPLTALKMESEVALMDDNATAKELRSVIASNIEETVKMESLINSLLRLTRLEVDEIQQQFTALNLKDLAVESIDHVKTMADAKSIAIKISGKDISIDGDHDSLVQMLVIFLDNAIKYSPKSSEIHLNLLKHSDAPVLQITDKGRGIAASDLVHVFDRFYRADSARTGSSGFGLGLSIAKLIADIHRADITISSQLEHGTKVTVTFLTAS